MESVQSAVTKISKLQNDRSARYDRANLRKYTSITCLHRFFYNNLCLYYYKRPRNFLKRNRNLFQNFRTNKYYFLMFVLGKKKLL